MNELLNKAEDPEKMLNQIVEDMQKELVEFRQTYAEVAANTKRCAHLFSLKRSCL